MRLENLPVADFQQKGAQRLCRKPGNHKQRAAVSAVRQLQGRTGLNPKRVFAFRKSAGGRFSAKRGAAALPQARKPQAVRSGFGRPPAPRTARPGVVAPHGEVSFMEEFQSGQMGQTVNLLPYGFDGPNPSSSTRFDNSGKGNPFPEFFFGHFRFLSKQSKKSGV